jgi:energy-coupling factor transport system ATP-binding protein
MGRSLQAVRFEGVSYAYGDFTALASLDLNVEEGEYIAIVGRNGSGKSTLAQHINALMRPDSGRVLTFSMDTKDDKLTLAVRSKAGMVFQNPDNQIVASVVEEDVAFGPENLGVPTAEIIERVAYALDAVGMAAYRERAPHHLSGGQKQRIAIAGVLAMEPKLIVFDESTSMLDPAGREAVLLVMDELNARGITILHITHNMDEALSAKRMVVMDGGRAVLDASPQTIFTDHMEALLALGMELPPLMQFCHELRLLGFDGGAGLNMEETVTRLCQLK